MDDNFDVEDDLGQLLHEEVFEETSHDLVCDEDMTMSTCMKIPASLEDSLSDLFAIFPYLVFNESASFICANYEGVSILPNIC